MGVFSSMTIVPAPASQAEIASRACPTGAAAEIRDQGCPTFLPF
jgi:hypothetical protein